MREPGNITRYAHNIPDIAHDAHNDGIILEVSVNICAKLHTIPHKR